MRRAGRVSSSNSAPTPTFRPLLFLSALLLLLSVSLTACSTITITPHPLETDSPQGPTTIPGDELAKAFVLREGLLKAITSVEDCPTAFETPGPGYKLISGRDFQDQKRAVWLTEDTEHNLHFVRTALYRDGLSKENIIERLREDGIVDHIFLAPVDKPPFDPTTKLAWYVSLRGSETTRDLVLDFQTGQTILEKKDLLDH